MAGKRIREVKEETERQLGRGTWTDSLARCPRPARKTATRRTPPKHSYATKAAASGHAQEVLECARQRLGLVVVQHVPGRRQLQPAQRAHRGQPLLVGWGLWGVGLFTLLWVGTQARQIAGLPFSLPHWAMSFPLAAFAALTFRLGTPGTTMALLGTLLLSLSSLLVLWLLLATLRGLRDGSLLAPEPVAAIVPAAG